MSNEATQEKRGYPLDILNKEDNPVMDVSIKMDVNFYSIMAEMSERFNVLTQMLEDNKIALDKKVEILNKSFTLNDVQIFANAMGNLIYSIAYNQGEIGFIEQRTEAEYKTMLEEDLKRRTEEFNAKGTS